MYRFAFVNLINFYMLLPFRTKDFLANMRALKVLLIQRPI